MLSVTSNGSACDVIQQPRWTEYIVLVSQSLWASAVVSWGKSRPWSQSRAAQRPLMSFCVQSPESWWRIQLLLQVRQKKRLMSSSSCWDLFFFSFLFFLFIHYWCIEGVKISVYSTDGYSYERESIESWIRGKNKTSPMTNLPLQTTLLTPNRSLKMAITRWKSSQ